MFQNFPPSMPTLLCPEHSPRPDFPPVAGSQTLFVVPRERTWKYAPNTADVITAHAEGGIPLLRAALTPSQPLDIGSIVYARMVGPPEGPDPMKRARASKEIGVEGKVVAARAFGEKEIEFVVKNESWSLASYVSIVAFAIPATSASLGLVQDLIASTPNGRERGDPSHKPVRNRITCIPGRGPRDGDLMYIVDDPHTPPELRFRQWSGRRIDAKRREQDAVEITAALGFGWVMEKNGRA